MRLPRAGARLGASFLFAELQLLTAGNGPSDYRRFPALYEARGIGRERGPLGEILLINPEREHLLSNSRLFPVFFPFQL